MIKSTSSPKIAIVMGSDSDLPVMKEAIEVCEHFQLGYEVRILSAHRTPERMMQYAQSAYENGIRVIIAGAGGAAHLPGMVAALTALPVIGVPVPSRYLQGVDSLYSIVQMPKGIPVATVAIGNAYNAGLLAIQILALQDPSLWERLQQFRRDQTQRIQEKDLSLAQSIIGSEP